MEESVWPENQWGGNHRKKKEKQQQLSGWRCYEGEGGGSKEVREREQIL